MAYQSGQSQQVTIPGPGPWGFRLAGGKDFNTPLHISKITPGGKAAQSGLLPNDSVATINGSDTSNFTHLEGQNKIKSVVGDLHLNIQRGSSNIWKPKISDDYSGAQPAVNVSLAADKQKFQHAGSAHNVAAKPFPGGGGGGPAGPGLGTATVVHKQFNSPVGIYSSENIAETFKGQTEGMITGALGGAPEDKYVGGTAGTPGAGSYDTSSPVYQAVHAEQSRDFGYSNPGTQSRSFKMLQAMTETTDDMPDYAPPPSQAPPPSHPPPAAAPQQAQPQPPAQRVAGTRSVRAPQTKPGAGGPKPEATLPMCEGCNRAIVGPFVKVRNRSLHPECFKCGTCGCSLRNQGYFWVEGGMYCERDAKAKAGQSPSDGVGGGVTNGTGGPGPTAPAHQAAQPAHQAPPPAHQAPRPAGPGPVAPAPYVAPQAPYVAPQTPYVAPQAPRAAPQVHQAPHQAPPMAHSAPQRFQPAQQRGPPRSQPVPASDRYYPRSTRQSEPIPKFRPPPTPPPKPQPRFQQQPRLDPNAIIAMALAKNPDVTKDIMGVVPVFAVDDCRHHEVIPAYQQPMSHLRPRHEHDTPMSGAPKDGVKVMFLPNNGAGVKQSPSQVAHQSRAPKQSPPRSSGAPHHQAPRPGPAAYHAPASHAPASSHPPAQRGPSAPSSAGSRGPTKMADSGTRTPVCEGCNTIIKGPFVTAIGRNWHPEHFVCTHCHESLKDRTFVEEKGKIYCEDDFVKLYAEKCHKCNKNIAGPGVSALGGKFHPECFVCEHCKEPIVGGKFRLSDGKPYCERDYRSLHSTMCSGCEFIIDPGDPWLEALEKAWHANCFVCSICQTPLEGQSFYAKMGRPFCQAHAN